jgi:hypothetical protein
MKYIKLSANQGYKLALYKLGKIHESRNEKEQAYQCFLNSQNYYKSLFKVGVLSCE